MNDGKAIYCNYTIFQCMGTYLLRLQWEVCETGKAFDRRPTWWWWFVTVRQGLWWIAAVRPPRLPHPAEHIL